MVVIGLTGKTGSGKSSICKILKSKGFYIIDTDKIAKEIVQKGMPALKKLQKVFGEKILNEEGTLNRKFLAEKAFSSEENRQKLNNATHSFITEKVRLEIENAKKRNFNFCVIDAAVLLESECKNFCDYIAVISCEKSERLKRIMKRDNLDEESANKRIDAQKSDEYYLENADIIIMNEEGSNLEKECERIFEFLEGKNENI